MLYANTKIIRWIVAVLLIATMEGSGNANGSDVGDDTSTASSQNSKTDPATTRPQEGAAMRQEFLAIKRPLVIEYKDYTIPARTGMLSLPAHPASNIIANNDLKNFIKKYNKSAIIREVVLPLLDDAPSSADACILFIVLETPVYDDIGALPMHQCGYKSSKDLGKWGQIPYDSLPRVLKEFASISLKQNADTQPSTRPSTGTE